MYYPPGVFRLKARQVLKGRWQTALLIALAVHLPVMLVQGLSISTGNNPLIRLESYVAAAARDGVLSEQMLVREIRDIISGTGTWVFFGLGIAALLVTPCLALGMYSWLISRLRGKDEPVSTVFSMVRHFFKAIGLQVLTALKIMAWMLPGLALGIALAVPYLTSGGAMQPLSALQSVSSAQQLPELATGSFLSLVVTALITVPAVMAYLRYALAELVMADVSSARIRACIRRSKDLMKTNKKTLALICLHFLLLDLLASLVLSLLGSGTLNMMLQLLAGLVIDLYLSASVAAFYLQLSYGNVFAVPTAHPESRKEEADPEDNPLN